MKIVSIRSDHSREFQNASFKEFCDEHGISQKISAPRTPQQNGVVKRKNRSLVKLVRTVINNSNLPKDFLEDSVSTTCYVSNHVIIKLILKKTSYELFKGIKSNISHFHVFNKRTLVKEEYMHVYFDESNPSKEDKLICDDDDVIIEVLIKDNVKDDHVERSEHKYEIIE